MKRVDLGQPIVPGELRPIQVALLLAAFLLLGCGGGTEVPAAPTVSIGPPQEAAPVASETVVPEPYDGGAAVPEEVAGPAAGDALPRHVAACCAALRQVGNSAWPGHKGFYQRAADACDAVRAGGDPRMLTGQLRAFPHRARVPGPCR